MFNGQMEMTFTAVRPCRNPSRRQRRLNRAQWWFKRMREVVELAADWPSGTPPRPEQTWLPGARHPNLEPQARELVCE